MGMTGKNLAADYSGAGPAQETVFVAGAVILFGIF